MSTQNNICFLPLAIPPISEKNKIVSNFNKSALKPYAWWNMELLLGERNFDIPIGAKKYEWNAVAKSNYYMIIKWVNEYLPFKNLFYVHLARAPKSIPPHVDENYVKSPFSHHMSIMESLKNHLLKNEPVGYRLIISGNRNSLYLCKDYDPLYQKEIPQPRTYCTIPDSTDAFLIRNSAVPHGIERAPDDFQRITGFLLGEIDEMKHQELISNSLKEYSQYTKYKKDIR